MSSVKDEMQPRLGKPVDSSSLHMLVYSYLLHNNCGRTAQAFARSCGLATSGRLASSDAPSYLSTIFNSVDEDISVDDDDVVIGDGGDDSVRLKSKGKEAALGAKQPAEASSAVQKSEEPTQSRESSGSARKDSGMDVCMDLREKSSADSMSEAERANELIDHHIEYLHFRQTICASIKAGEPEVASDLLSEYFRQVLIPPPASKSPAVNSLPVRREFNATLLRFRLDTQHYVELVANHQQLDALQYGQRTLWRYPEIFDTWLEHSLGFTASSYHLQQSSPQQYDTSTRQHPGSHTDADDDFNDDDIVPREELKMKREEIMQHITDVAALVAYPDPHKSTLAYLLMQERRQELAASVNTAILRSMRFPREPALITLVRQLATTSAYLVGYRSSSSSVRVAAGEERPQTRQPWVLDTFVNSDSVSDTFA
ncbi:hypothetical protein IWW50_004965 [Coemansia erecta]|nr:hypothetical protein IWW50_004965 [Coemansia erecta]